MKNNKLYILAYYLLNITTLIFGMFFLVIIPSIIFLKYIGIDLDSQQPANLGDVAIMMVLGFLLMIVFLIIYNYFVWLLFLLGALIFNLSADDVRDMYDRITKNAYKDTNIYSKLALDISKKSSTLAKINNEHHRGLAKIANFFYKDFNKGTK